MAGDMNGRETRPEAANQFNRPTGVNQKRRSKTMFRHMAILKFKDDADPAAIQRYFENFPKLAESLPVIRSWYLGRNEGSGGESHVKRHGHKPNYDVGLVLEFDDQTGYRDYAESPEHQSFFEEFCAPIFAERVVVQFHPK
jgi:hypothetical protein